RSYGDWSSDVCSSDLGPKGGAKGQILQETREGVKFKTDDGQTYDVKWEDVQGLLGAGHFEPDQVVGGHASMANTAMAMWGLVSRDRKSVVWGERVDGG